MRRYKEEFHDYAHWSVNHGGPFELAILETLISCPQITVRKLFVDEEVSDIFSLWNPKEINVVIIQDL